MSPFNSLRKNLTVKRPAAGTWVGGRWQDGVIRTLTIKASVQPATTDDLQSLPESRRTLGVYRLYSDEPFQSVIEGKQNPDIVEIYGDDYEVMQSMPWQNNLINHYKTLVARVQPE
jgi:hypothetical protein